MSINFKYLAIAIPAIVAGCGGSSGGSSGDGGLSLSDDSSINISNTEVTPTNSGNPLISSNDSTIVGESDVFDPNSIGNESVCSAPYYETLSGIYQGTMSINTDEGLSCSWNVELRMVRFYESRPPITRSFCNFDAQFFATPTTAMTEGGPSDFDSETGEFVETTLPCLAADPAGDIIGRPTLSDGRELTDPRFPLNQEFDFFNDVILTSQQTGRTIGVYPTGSGGGTVNRAFELDLVFDGTGGVTVEAATRPDPIWFTNITKVQTDIEFLATEF